MIKPLMERCNTVAEKCVWFPLLLTRVAVGWIFIESGWGKFQSLPRVVGYFQELGIPMAQVQAPFVAGVELIGGLCLWLGVFSRGASFLLSCTMIVALVTAKRTEIASFSDLFGMSEFLYVVLLSWIFVYGCQACPFRKILTRKTKQN